MLYLIKLIRSIGIKFIYNIKDNKTINEWIVNLSESLKQL